ncbi:Uncharacterised protein [Burkholderia mallei]|nr:hypothetical protein DM51_2581 [Burkholderia mallei]SUW47933.1 Uncharacterised protein [Burkholderia mallei]
MSLAAFLAAGFAFEARACGEGARRAGDRRRSVAIGGGHRRARWRRGFRRDSRTLFSTCMLGLGRCIRRAFGFCLTTRRHADTPTRRHADTPTRRHADTPTRRHADTPTRRHAHTPTRPHADGSTVPSVYESIPVSPMQSRRLADSPIYRFASACRAAVPRPSGAERSIIGSRVHTTPTRRPPAVARPFEAARRRRHIRRASRPTAVHSLEAHRRRKP